MVDTTERDAVNAERALAEARQSLQSLRPAHPTVVAALEKLRSGDSALAETVETWTTRACAQATSAVNWLDGTENEQPTPVAAGPSNVLKDRAHQLRHQADAIDAATFAQQLKSTSTQVAELQGQISVADSKDAIIAEVRRLQARVKIDAAKKATDTGAITRKASDFTRIHVTREVRDQFTRESERLRLRRITLDDTSGVKGRLLHRPALLGAVQSTAVTKC